jgi:transposase-like protein
MKTYSVKEIADLLGTNPETVRRWIRNGDGGPGKRASGRVRDRSLDAAAEGLRQNARRGEEHE